MNRRTLRGGLVAVLTAVAALGLGCAPPDSGHAGGSAAAVRDGEAHLTGEIEVRVYDYPDGRSVERLRLLPAGGGRALKLTFASGHEPRLAPGTPVEVWGRASGDTLAVGQLRPLPLRLDDVPGDLEVSRRGLVNPVPLPKRRLAFVLVDLGGGVNLTAEQANARAFGLGPMDQSMKQVVLEYSFGRQDLEGQVIGPLKATMTGCDEDGLADSLRDQIPAGFDNIVWYFGRRVNACGWAGVAPLGRPGRIAGELWVNADARCLVATHEFGHNLGLQHAARLRCGAMSFVDAPNGACMDSEYGDSSDVMGDGCNHVNGYSKTYLSWMQGCNSVRVGASGTFTLFPTERACNGVQVLLVPMPKDRRYDDTTLRYYFLEMRAPIGLDGRLVPQVQIRVGANVVTTTGGKRTFILDTKPATTAIDGLKLGEMFQDPAGGVRWSVTALEANQATVKVEIDAAVMPMMPPGPTACLDGTAFVPPGPAACGNDSEGTGGSGGAASDGGAPPTGGAPDAATGGGTGGEGGRGGAGGSGGSGAGSGGSGAGQGTGGRGGSGASAGSGGSGAVAGAGGRGGASGGTSGNAGSGPASLPPTTVDSTGCGCDLGGREGGGRGVAVGVALLGMVVLARRRRR
jgi:hypothetical protein